MANISPGTTSQPTAKPFDYGATAELFPNRGRKLHPKFSRYQRFACAAEAVRFAIEDVPPAALMGAYLEVEEERFDSGAIRRLYESDEYPFAARRKVQL
jgi:hypothetical protein